MMSREKSAANPGLKFGVMYVLFGLALFLTAGTIYWLEGWVYLIIMISFSVTLLIYLKKKDPELLASRAKLFPTKGWDKIITIVSGVFQIGMLIIPGLDAVRFQWSSVPLFVEIIGFVGVVCGVIIIFLVNRENTYLSRIVEIQKDRGHKVITTGPYKIVRHPMYLGVTILYIFQCFALGSLYSLICVAVVIVAIIVRTSKEDKLLHEELEGYKEYASKTRSKLVPKIW